MPRVRFTLPQVKLFPDTRPSACTHCGSVNLVDVSHGLRIGHATSILVLPPDATDCRSDTCLPHSFDAVALMIEDVLKTPFE